MRDIYKISGSCRLTMSVHPENLDKHAIDMSVAWPAYRYNSRLAMFAFAQRLGR